MTLSDILRTVLVSLALIVSAPAFARQDTSSPPVAVTETNEVYTLDNGIIVAVISKRSGDLISMTYNGMEMLELRSGGHSGGYWSHDVTGASEIIPRISIDPAENDGAFAEVSIRGISGGNLMGHGPGTPPEGDLEVDIDIRWAIERGQPGLYTYSAFEHPAEYGDGTMAEARIAIKLMEDFDHIHADDARSGRYPLLNEGIDKYVYVALQAEERAFGWTSSEHNLGWFLLNPSAEYLSGGPTKAEFLVHGTHPTVLSYWKSSHYYGANVTTQEGEHWARVIGPLMFYVNEGPDHESMVADARARLAEEEARWPYDWVDASGYTPPEERSTISGQIALHDAGQTTYSGSLHVGLTQTPYQVPTPDGQMRDIEWQNDGKFYQFWTVSTDPSGAFTIPNVPPGTYTLHAFADDVLGEFMQTNVTVTESTEINLGTLNWTPVRFGEEVWSIGRADRSAEEFAFGSRYFEPGIQLQFNAAFPEGVTYDVATSTPDDWFFAHFPTPHTGEDYEIRPFVGIVGDGDATPYTIQFTLEEAPDGIATLRMAFTSTTNRELQISVNGTPLDPITFNVLDAALMRHQMYGRWFEKRVSFDASLLQAGENEITLTIPAGQINASVIYDYLRLELDGEATEPPPPLPTLNLRPRAPVPSSTRPVSYEIHTRTDDARFGLGPDASLLEAIPLEEAGQILDEWAPSPDGRYIAYTTFDPAAEPPWQTLRVYDLETASHLTDEILWVRNSTIAWSGSSAGFFYSRYNDPSPIPEVQRFNTAQSVFYHRLGNDRLDDQLIYTSDRASMHHYAEVSDDGRWLVINASVDGNGLSEIIVVDLYQTPLSPFKAITTMRDSWQFAGSLGDQLYFVTTEGAAQNRRLVSIDMTDPSLERTETSIETIGASADRLRMARLMGNMLWTVHGDDVSHRLSHQRLAGTSYRIEPAPPPANF